MNTQYVCAVLLSFLGCGGLLTIVEAGFLCDAGTQYIHAGDGSQDIQCAPCPVNETAVYRVFTTDNETLTEFIESAAMWDNVVQVSSATSPLVFWVKFAPDNTLYVNDTFVETHATFALAHQASLVIDDGDNGAWCDGGALLQACTIDCGVGGHIAEPCSAAADSVCGSCNPFNGEHWCDGWERYKCKEQCELPSSFIEEQCHAYGDAICGSCMPFDSVHWCDAVDRHTCSMGCEYGTHRTATCNATSDRVCSACPIDSWCVGAVAYKCPAYSTTLGVDALASADGCKCNAGYRHEGDICQRCPLDRWCPGGNAPGGGMFDCPGNTTAPPGSSHIGDCECITGFLYSEDLGRCEPYGPGAVFTGGASTPCPDPHMWVPPGSDLIEDCVCRAGYFAPLYVHGNETCSKCSAGSYCTGDGGLELVCPDGAESPVQAHVLKDCFCPLGSFREDPTDATETCKPCPLRSWCSGGVRNLCPVDTFSTAMSTSLEDCRCVAGYGYDEDSESCQLCRDGSYKPSTGNTVCVACPNLHMTTNGVGKTSWMTCGCVAGYHEDSPGVCNECGLSSWCAGGSVSPMSCGGNQTTEATVAKTDVECVCMEGYYRVSESQCLICDEGFWCANETRMACESNWGVLVLGASSPGACIEPCLRGMYRPAGSDECVACLSGFWCPGAHYDKEQCTLLDCTDNEKTLACNATHDMACVACEYTAHSAGLHGVGVPECEWACEAGYYAEGSECHQCDVISCPPGFRVVSCTREQNGLCVSCAVLPQNGVYVTGIECTWGCMGGYWKNDATQACCSNAAFQEVGGGCSCLPGWVGDGNECVL